MIHCYCDEETDGSYREEFNDFLCASCYRKRLRELNKAETEKVEARKESKL